MPPMTALWLCRFAQTSAAVLLAGILAFKRMERSFADVI